MSSMRLRSSSVGSKPRPRIHRPSRAESAAALALDVRCACQFYETKSLLPERVNPVGYNTAEEFEPCVHVQAKLRNREDVERSRNSELGFPVKIAPNIMPSSPSQNMLVPLATRNLNIPPEFSPIGLDNTKTENTLSTPALNNRSVSCNNMGILRQPSTPYLKQKDPSTSSLLRKRMSEERQGLSTFDKRMSQSTASRDRFIPQKDPSQSTILRRKMYNRSTASFDRMSNERFSSERIAQAPSHQALSHQALSHQESSHQAPSHQALSHQAPSHQTLSHQESSHQEPSNQYQASPRQESPHPTPVYQAPSQPERLPNERTFYHDTNDAVRNSNVNVSETRTLERAAPLSMKSHGNRRFVPTSTENLPEKPLEQPQIVRHNEINKLPMKMDEPPLKMQSRTIEREMVKNHLRDRNVSDEEKVQILLSRSQSVTAAARTFLERKQSEVDMTRMSELRPMAVASKMQLMNANDVKTVEVEMQSKPQVQYVAKMENTLHPMEAQTNDYSYSKLFDNYKSDQVPMITTTNASTPDLNYVRQHDPSYSPFTRNRYRAMNTPTPTDLISSEEKLLPPAGDFPERRASEQCNPQMIRQKDLRTSNVLNRRRRNLSQTSLSHENDMIDSINAPLKIVKTLSFEKNLSQQDDSMSPYIPTGMKMTKGVSFEFDQIFANDRNDRHFSNVPKYGGPTHRFPHRDHEYEPIGEPIIKPEQAIERPTVKISEPEPEFNEKPDVVHVETISDDEYRQGTESPIRSITPYTDNSRTEELHTSQIDDSVIEEVPLRREDRKKKSFITNAGEHTRNLQHKISSQASNLRTKFRRSLKSSGNSSPKERKKFKRTDITSKFKAIHMPKMSKPEFAKFKMSEKFRFSKTEPQPEPITSATITTDEAIEEQTAASVLEEEVVEVEVAPEQKHPTMVTVTTEEIIETKTVPKKRFEFGSYPKIFNRFKSQPKADDHDATDYVSEDANTDRETQPSSSSFSTHFATVPRTASKIKNSIINKWNKSSFNRSHEREESESNPQGSETVHDGHEDSVERRLNLASKVSMEEEEEEPLGILQTKEQIQLASYDEENRAIHEISKAREIEFKARKPLVHQDSDLVSEESNRDIDWEECERMRNKILGPPKTHIDYEKENRKEIRADGRRRNDSNFSTEETQSSGSSGDRRRTGVIEDIDDDEFFLRQRGVSQDNAEISQYISSAIRKDFSDQANRQYPEYSYEGYNNNNAEYPDEYQFEERPRKPLRRPEGFSRSFESYDDYNNRNEISDNELPVATQYFPRHDDENISFYDNEYIDDMDQPNIMSREHRYDSDIDNETFHRNDIKPEVPKRRRKGARSPGKQDSIETNEEVFLYRSEQSFSMPDESLDVQFIEKPERKNRSISSKSDLAYEHGDSVEQDETTLNKYSPSNSRYTINIRESNGYATVKKESPRPPAPARRRKRSTKSIGESNLDKNNVKSSLVDSPYPDRPKRNYNIIVPARPPRRASSSSLIDQHKPPSVAASDVTQYEEIDDIDLNDAEDNSYFKQKMQDRPLPAPPRPPREKRRRRKPASDDKYDDDNDAEFIAQSFDDGTSEFSNREFIGAEMATQTSLEIDDYLNDITQADDHLPEPYTITVEDILRNSDDKTSRTTSDDNLSKGIQRFRESTQRSYSERSRASTDRPSSRPITPSAILIERRIARSPIQTDATIIMQPIDVADSTKPDYRTDSAESEYVPYADDDVQIDTEDERIINAAIQRYQMLGHELEENSPSPPVPTTIITDSTSEINEERSIEDAPLPPPRRKSSASTILADTMNVPLAQAETLSVASTQELNQIESESVNDLSTMATSSIGHERTEPIFLNIRKTTTECEPKEPQTVPVPATPSLQISPEMMQEIIERVRETLPAPPPPPLPPAEPIAEIQLKTEVATKPPPPPALTDTESKKDESKEEPIESEEPPRRPPTPTDYTLTSDIPASFYRLRTGISDDESPALPPAAAAAAAQKHRQRKHTRRCDSSSEEECHRRHHHHAHHHVARAPDTTIADLSGQLIRACGRALSSTLNTAGHSCVDFIRGLTKNQDDKQKDLSLVLVILIIIVASLMMLGISGDRSVHHHHWDYFNPPDNLGRP